MGVPVLHNYYTSCTPYTQSTNVFCLRLSGGWTILTRIWHGCLNPAWVAGSLDRRTTFVRVPAAPNDVIACGVHTSVNPAGTSRIWRHPPEISSSSVCVFVWAHSVATDRHPSPPPARQQRTPRLAKQTRIDDRSGSGKWGDRRSRRPGPTKCPCCTSLGGSAAPQSATREWLARRSHFVSAARFG